jgi:hypothetical protein
MTRPPPVPLPPPPERPDCCGGGCAVCVLDTYAEALEQWQREVEALRANEGKPAATDDDSRP